MLVAWKPSPAEYALRFSVRRCTRPLPVSDEMPAGAVRTRKAPPMTTARSGLFGIADIAMEELKRSSEGASGDRPRAAKSYVIWSLLVASA